MFKTSSSNMTPPTPIRSTSPLNLPGGYCRFPDFSHGIGGDDLSSAACREYHPAQQLALYLQSDERVFAERLDVSSVKHRSRHCGREPAELIPVPTMHLPVEPEEF